MSRLLRSAVRLLFALLAVAGGLTLLAASAVAQPTYREVKYDVPSLKGNIDTRRVTFNDSKTLSAWVRLPAGYDDQPDRRWPVLYLLHGWEDSSHGWIQAKKGNLEAVLPADFPGIVVMPESGKEWFMNWADPVHNPGHRWGDYLRDEVVPFMEQHLRILPGRANHAIGGLSMGGFGAIHNAQTMPTYFGQILSFSALVNNQDTTFSSLLDIASVGHPGYSSVFGWTIGPYAESVNPLKNARDFKGFNISLYYGTPNVAQLNTLDIRARVLAILELGDNLAAQQWSFALRGQGADVYELNDNNGIHDWHWWRRYLRLAVDRGIWTPPPITETSQARDWVYDTMQGHGNAWGLGYRFAALPTQRFTLIRHGQQLTGKGGAGVVRIAGGAADDDASGDGSRPDCTWTLTVPFTVTLPAGC